MTLAEIRKGWNHAAREDAFFNILTEPGKAGGGWDPKDFFARGHTEIHQVMCHLNDDLGLTVGHGRALDFGCGVGRLTQALAGWFEFVDGVDVSSAMVDQAIRWNEHDDRVSYWTCGRDLRRFDDATFDFVYSVITLQHMPQLLQRGYIREFVRLLRKGGLAVFQIPEGREDHIHPQAWLSMYSTDRGTVEGWGADAGGVLVDMQPSEHGGDGWKGYTYTVGKT